MVIGSPIPGYAALQLLHTPPPCTMGYGTTAPAYDAESALPSHSEAQAHDVSSHSSRTGREGGEAEARGLRMVAGRWAAPLLMSRPGQPASFVR